MRQKSARGLGVKGRLLVARPELRDPNFQQSIVYMVRHNDREGSLGFILNRPLPRTLGEIARSTQNLGPLGQLPVYWGGPVHGDRITLVYFDLSGSREKIRSSIGLELHDLRARQAGGAGWVRAFAGCSSWGGGQLRREMQELSWHVAEPHPVLFDEKHLAGLWPTLVSGDERWRALMPYAPHGGELN